MKLLTLIACLFCAKTSFASVPVKYIFSDTTIENIDTSINKKEYQLNHKEFLEKYGKDDSSRALINFYFKRRTSAKIWFSISAPLIILFTSALVSETATNSSSNYVSSEGGALAESLLGFFIIVSGISFLISTLTWIKFSRKKLLKVLTKHFNGKAIPKTITRNKAFIRLLKNIH